MLVWIILFKSFNITSLIQLWWDIIQQNMSNEYKLTFFLNWMGPVSTKWYEDNKVPYRDKIIKHNVFKEHIMCREYNISYSCGRIDVYGHPDYPYNYEYSVDIMESESWYKLKDYLNDLKLDYLPDDVQEIYDMFEKDTGWKIQWWKDRNEH